MPFDKELNEYILTDQEKDWIRKFAEEFKFNVKKLTQGLTGDEDKDGRSFEGKAIKKFIVEELGQKPKVTTLDSKQYNKEITLKLDEDQQGFVRENYLNSTPIEITTLLFPHVAEIVPRSRKSCAEYKAVYKFIQELGGNDQIYKEIFMKSGKFQPPKNLLEGLNAVNKYARQKLEMKTLKDREKESVLNMCNSLGRVAVVNSINSFSEAIERECYLESFVSDTWDKVDITSSETSLYFDLAGERVHLIQIQKHEKSLMEQFSEAVENGDKLQYNLNEAIDKQIQNRDKCMARIDKLHKNLEGTRIQRLKDKPAEEKTIMSIIEVFMYHKKRQEFLKMRKIQDEMLEEEINTLEDQDEYIAKIMGVTKSEIISQQEL